MDGLTPVVVWDVDDVLNDLLEVWFADVWVPTNPNRRISFDQLRQNPPLAVLDISRSDYVRSLDEFRAGPGYAALAPNQDILAWMRSEGPRYHHVALSATAFHAAPSTAAWVLHHFGHWIREFAFIPAFREGERLPAYDADKGAWVIRHGYPAVLVDDAPSNVAAAEGVGVRAFTWPRPWNQSARTATDTLAALSQLLEGGEPW